MDGMLKQVYGISYIVSDWERAKRFYKETLGLPLLGAEGEVEGWAEFGDMARAHLAIMPWPGPGPAPSREGGGIAIFTVDDAVKVVAELRKRGVRCEDPVPVPGMVTWANFYDPDGNRLQVAGPPPSG
jgi:catechol 2,3-dioxygenase-like lactoylglutathione lyase family enzyme